MNKSIKKNYIYNVIYQIVLIILPIIVTPYISRVLLPAGVGQYSFSLSLITYFTIAANFGFNIYSQREISKYQDDKQKQSEIFWEIVFCRFLAVIVCLAIHFILLSLGVYGGYKLIMLILSINIFAVGFDIAFFFQGNEEFGKIVLVNIVIKILFTSFIFIFVKKISDVWIYTLINSLMLICSNLGMWLLLIGKLNKVDFKRLKVLKHLKPALLLFLPTIAISIYTVLDKSLIGLITHSDAQNGLYEKADQIVKLAMTVVLCFGTVMVSRNSHEFAKGNYEKIKENTYKAFHFIWLLGLPMMAGVMLISDNFVPWFLGESFIQSANIMKIFAILIIVIGASNILGCQFLIPTKKDKLFTIAIICGSILNLILSIPLIYFMQAFGAALATVFAELIVTSTMFFMTRKELSVKTIFKLALKPIIATISMVLAVLPLALNLSVGIFQTILMAVVGVTVYGIVILILRDSFVIKYLKLAFNKILRKNKNN